MEHTQVLIVGAGPIGLMVAAELHRRGTDFRIIDKHPGVMEATKAAALHARALEYFPDTGVAETILAEGQRIDILELRTGYRDRLTVDFRGMGDTAHPHMVDIPQARTEHILTDHLTAAGVRIERGWELTGLRPGAETVTATLTAHDEQSAGSAVRTVSAEYVVACDGVNSTVRRLLDVPFDGADYADDWALCDAVVRWPLPRNEMTFSGDHVGICGVFPLPGERRYRLAYTQSRDRHGNLIYPDLADAQNALHRSGIDGVVESAEQFSTFNLSHRRARHMRQGRIFLVGDAAHVHTPFGGQGLNLGVADAANLAWKLAEVCAGRAPAGLLDSYEPERHRVAAQVVRFTHLGAEAMLLRNDPRRYLRDAVFGALEAAPAGRARIARRLAQLTHTYRGTRWVTGHAGGLHAGDRLPDYLVFDGVTQRQVRLHDTLEPDGYTLLISGATEDPRPLAQRLTGRWNLNVAVRALTTDWRVAATLGELATVLLDRGRQARALLTRRPAAFLIRPDRHIGYAGPLALTKIERHLTAVATPRVAPAAVLTKAGT